MHGGWHHAETVLEKQWSLLYESLRNLLGTTGVGVDQVGKNEQKKEDMRMIITRSLYFGTLDARETRTSSRPPLPTPPSLAPQSTPCSPRFSRH